ncbi:tRNA-dihydrouridine(20) synthase [NAD(P)+]-like [Paramacrobiotus metropolitanus]|uniref:tRNA-dihydrouridine(20) synthase [NAD(P)+]-like n=1 Tax=Paramacrobiotus metropolitanus TaxID=2943436 RepID=UPI0024463245|nr:tRNA-dihydrouridine(20) synthase [NAD(P)+]-like [Paramacrobiotus metropolitanus]
MADTDASRRGRLEYSGKHILAPMVRMGTLPFRSLCLDYGADIVYSEEIVDIKFLQSKRTVNTALNTVDYTIPKELIFRTHPCEHSSVVLQIGTSNSDQAVQVARMVENDIAGLDINMGCPKDYSVRGGMGAALLKTPDVAEDILRRIRAEFKKPLTCKIRLFHNMQDSVNFAKRMEATGIEAIAVHGRTKEERPSHKNNSAAIRAIAQAVSIPVIANGGSSDIRCYNDLEKFRLECGASSVMVARSVQTNPSIFRREGLLSREQMISDFLRKSIDFDIPFRNAKYGVQHLFGDTSTEFGQTFLATRDYPDMCEVFGFEDYYAQKHVSTPEKDRLVVEKKSCSLKRDREEDIVVEEVDYNPISKKLKKALNTFTPKSILLEHCKKHSIAPAQYSFTSTGKTFCGSVLVMGKTFISTVPHRTKKDAEQAATVVALRHIMPEFSL